MHACVGKCAHAVKTELICVHYYHTNALHDLNESNVLKNKQDNGVTRATVQL